MTLNRIVLLAFAYLFGMALASLGALALGWLPTLVAGPLIAIARFFGIGALFALGCTLDWKRSAAFALVGTLALDAIDSGVLHSGLAALPWLSPREPLAWLVLGCAAVGAFGGAKLIDHYAEDERLEHARMLIFSMLTPDR
jgi:hypothetical protein